MNILKAGIHFDVKADDYFADPCEEPSFTQSLAKVLVGQTPLHARYEHPRLAPPKPDDEDEACVAHGMHSIAERTTLPVRVGDHQSEVSPQRSIA